MSSYQVGEDGIFIDVESRKKVPMKEWKISYGSGSIQELQPSGEWELVFVICGGDEEVKKARAELVHKLYKEYCERLQARAEEREEESYEELASYGPPKKVEKP